jgi:hypothetical protein
LISGVLIQPEPPTKNRLFQLPKITNSVNMKSVFSLAVLALGATGVLAANFSGSCETSSIKVSGRTLTANCKNIFGQLKCSKLDLNRCLKNNYGRLAADPTGAG